MKNVMGRLHALRAASLRVTRSLRGRQRVEVGVALLAAVVCLVTVGIQVGPALAEPKTKGVPVPPDVLPALVVGATSCPAMSAPKLAGQLMAASGFRPTARSESGEGLAGLDSAGWEKWAPWPGAQHGDVLANVLALAHRTCDFMGRVRDADIDADDWEAAVAGGVVGMEAVLRSGSVPSAARKLVDTVASYANWYADQPEFSEGQAALQAPGAVAVPEELVEPIRRAGRVCPAVLPAPRVAALVMALSGFNANLRGPNGGQGIAQFTSSLWEQYRPATTAGSVWDPEVAIPVLGTAMCDLRNQLSGIRADDTSGGSMTLATAAYQWGVTAVRAEGGVPRHASVKQVADLVIRYLETYRADVRLQELAKPSPSPSLSASAPARPSASPTGKPPVVPAPGQSSSAPAGPTVWDPKAEWQFKNRLSWRVMELPGKNVTAASGTTVQVYDNDKGTDQFWRIANAPDPEYVVITNVYSGKVLGIRDGTRENGAELVMLNRVAGDVNQQWKLRYVANGSYAVINRRSGKALDIGGDDCCALNAAPITQHDFKENAVDMRWSISSRAPNPMLK